MESEYELPETTILLVDDDPLFVEVTAEMLRYCGTGLRIHTALNGVMAIAVCQEIWPDVLITDLSMPEMDGVQLIEKLLEDERTPPRVIVITALGPHAPMQRLQELGVRTILAKPIGPEQLSAAINEELSRGAEKSPPEGNATSP